MDWVDVDVREVAPCEAHVALEIEDLKAPRARGPQLLLSFQGTLFEPVEHDGSRITAREYQALVDRTLDRSTDGEVDPWWWRSDLPLSWRGGGPERLRTLPRDASEVKRSRPLERSIRFVGDEREACARKAALSLQQDLIEYDGELWMPIEDRPRWSISSYEFDGVGVSTLERHPQSCHEFSIERFDDALAYARELGPQRRLGMFVPIAHKVLIHDLDAVRTDDFLAMARSMLDASSSLEAEAPVGEGWPEDAVVVASRLYFSRSKGRELDAEAAALAIADTCALRKLLHRGLGNSACHFLRFSRCPVRRWTEFEHRLRSETAELFERARLRSLADDAALAAVV